MTNISKNLLSAEHEQKLLQQFSSLFTQKKSKDIAQLFEEILTPSEQVMLIKRVAIVLMLAEDFSTYKIAKTLKVSDATVRSLRTQFRKKEFEVLLNNVRHSDFNKEKFWETIDVLLRLGMPPRGKGRWKYIYSAK